MKLESLVGELLTGIDYDGEKLVLTFSSDSQIQIERSGGPDGLYISHRHDWHPIDWKPIKVVEYRAQPNCPKGDFHEWKMLLHAHKGKSVCCSKCGEMK